MKGIIFERGDSYRSHNSEFTTYGIDKLTNIYNSAPTIHHNFIEIHGDEALVNKIIDLLNGAENE